MLISLRTLKNFYLPILCLSLLFSQTEIDTLWTFTNCGQEGRFGPTLEQCEAEYEGTSLDGQVNLNEGIQEWTAPFSGQYSIEVWGAKGGNGVDQYANLNYGARMQGTFDCMEGEIYKIVVGKMGGDGVGNCNCGGRGVCRYSEADVS